MKKVSLLIALVALVFGNAFAQMSYDFNDGTAGAKIAQTYGMPWTTWTDNPGGSEDGVFGEIGGSMAAHFTYGNDQILYLGDHSTGVYDLEFDAYVPNGKNGYFNVLHHFDGTNSDNCIWAIQVYMHMTNDGQSSTVAPGQGTVHAGSNGTADIPCVYDQWMHFRVHVSADTDIAQFYFNVAGQPEVMYAEWQWSLDSFGEEVNDRRLGAMDFFPPQNAANSEYYIDNLTVTLESNDEVIVDDDFEAYTVGSKIAEAAQAAGNDWWTTWSENPGSEEDGEVATQGTKAGHFTYGNDQVLLLGDAETALYEISFDMYIPNGKDAYNNVLHIFAGTGSEWGVEVNYKKSDGTYIEVAGNQTNFTCPYDEWFNVSYNIDLDNDLATFYVENEEIVTWQYSLKTDGTQGTRRLAAIDFYPPTSAAVSEYYIDNVYVVKHGGASAPQIVFDPVMVEETLGEDDITTVDITIANEGNSIGDWMGWIEFGQGEAGTQSADLAWHDGEENQGIGSSTAVTREMGIRLPASAYAGSAMGMKIVSAQYLVGTNHQSADHNYIFRIYGQGMNNQPGELLAEKTVNSTAAGTWITATFDEVVYMTGQAYWATVQLEQGAGEYPLSMDGGMYGELQDGNWLSTNGGTFSHCYSAPTASSDGFEGAWLITVNCQGQKIPGTWASMNKDGGSVMGGATDDITLSLNTFGIQEGSYSASIHFITNDESLPYVEIPLTLVADFDAVIENAANAFNVYPNPTTGMVTVEGENIAAIAIYSAAGQLVNVVNTTTIDMSAYGTGVYFLNIVDNANNTTVTRVVVK